ncbi:dienelactone hydrolase family protein [Polymorphobacter fuscus]|uniref:Prolyl oligopeptidase family serine peptidase n=1 Tax=Sandarakinorhabdus fusca TaxID=1439888 RepID=A0A7C9GVF9_9SPHN|nr:dienelactone hydrolase family protein [Polymorphobacter fuscus]KAB7648519.1 prolyl oligopeptidase family serine peptidase [Polymorphobacter fuscus]MQT16054.1 prolyl oligopeptidase family serine peptidase [Polymorphobacter fuscus]NJC07668.1 dienelactone hydrolase [Polymorphobacter fuscus]
MPALHYTDGDALCEGHVALPSGTGPHPAVVIFHNWAGQGPHEVAAAERLAAQGYAAIAADIYGAGVRGEVFGDNSALMDPWMVDRAGLRTRILAAVAAAAAHPAVDPDRIAVMGYCFGGLCALDAARSADPRVRGAVSFHGSYSPPTIGAQAPITAKVLVLHGWTDPVCPPDATVALAHELEAAGADWQIHAYGQTGHAFTAPGLNNRAAGMFYHPDADRRSWRAMTDFLDEVFG